MTLFQTLVKFLDFYTHNSELLSLQSKPWCLATWLNMISESKIIKPPQQVHKKWPTEQCVQNNETSPNISGDNMG